MSAVLKICEQMVKLDRLIKTSRDDKLKRIMRDEYKRLTDEIEAVVETQSKQVEKKGANRSETATPALRQDCGDHR